MCRRAISKKMPLESELGWQIAVDFESDADFHECRSCPIHSLLPPSHISQQHRYVAPRPPEAGLADVSVLIRWAHLWILFLHDGCEMVEVFQHQRDVFLELNRSCVFECRFKLRQALFLLRLGDGLIGLECYDLILDLFRWLGELLGLR